MRPKIKLYYKWFPFLISAIYRNLRYRYQIAINQRKHHSTISTVYPNFFDVPRGVLQGYENKLRAPLMHKD